MNYEEADDNALRKALSEEDAAADACDHDVRRFGVCVWCGDDNWPVDDVFEPETDGGFVENRSQLVADQSSPGGGYNRTTRNLLKGR